MKAFPLVALLLSARGSPGRRLDFTDTNCPEEFFLHNGQCLKAFLNDEMSWVNARSFCQSWGGDLASPRNVTSLHDCLLKEYGPAQRFWVGGSDREDEGDWKWITGQRIDWEDWMGFNPNDCCGGEDCALLGTSWSPPLNDNNCNNNRNFLCELPLDI